MNKILKTFNIQHSTPNRPWPAAWDHWALKVEGWLFDVSLSFPA
jgi:hypothetical protein